MLFGIPLQNNEALPDSVLQEENRRKGEKKKKKKASEREVLTGYTSHRTDMEHPRVTDLEDVPKLASRSQHAGAGRELIN